MLRQLAFLPHPPTGTCGVETCVSPRGPSDRLRRVQMVQATNGTFYGITYDGGASNYGTIFTGSWRHCPLPAW
jgi:hypothetical protein